MPDPDVRPIHHPPFRAPEPRLGRRRACGQTRAPVLALALTVGAALALGMTGCASPGIRGGSTPAARVELARDAAERGRHAAALETLEDVLSSPTSPPAAEPGETQSDVRARARAIREKARYWRCVCLRKLGRYDGAFLAQKRFLEDYPISSLAPKAEEEMFELGVELLRGAGGGFLGIPRALGMSLEGPEVLRYLKDVSPNGRWAADAQRIIAQYYFDLAEFDVAMAEYQALIDDHPGSIWQPLAEYRLPLCKLKHSRGAAYDRKLLEDALAGFQEYERRHADGDYAKLARVHAKEVHNLLAEKSFRTGAFYLADKRVEAAVFYFKSTVQVYPETTWAARSLDALRGVAADYRGSAAAASAAETLELAK